MNVRIAHSGNAAGHEVPDCYSAIVTAYRQESPASVEGARESFAARVQNSIVVLRSPT